MNKRGAPPGKPCTSLLYQSRGQAIYKSALTIAAATLLPPFLPFATMYGTPLSIIISFDSQTCTNPTGTPITKAGLTSPLLINLSNSSSAVGAFPTTKMIGF